MKKSTSAKSPVKKKARAKKAPAPAKKRVSKSSVAMERKLPLRRILIPVDFSGHSRNALRYAIPMAEQYNAELYLIYVVEPTVYPADFGFGQVVMPGLENELRTKSERELQRIIDAEIGGRVKAHALVRTGKPHQEILDEAMERSIDMIVIATHGHTGVEQILFGSTAMRIVRLAHCPVLTVRPPT